MRHTDLSTRTVLARNLKYLRTTGGWTQEELAEAAKISRSAVATIEGERYASPRLEILERIAKALGTELSLLLSPKSDVRPCLPPSRDARQTARVKACESIPQKERQCPS